MEEQRETSARFLIQMVMNIFICKQAMNIIAKNTIKSDKIQKKSIGLFILLTLILLTLNIGAFKIFKDVNLYEKIGVSRIMSTLEIKQWAQTMKIQYYQKGVQLPKLSLKQFTDIVSVLTHPARRLSYDSFGYHSVQYAWAFKSSTFILQTIIGSSIFFIICTVVRVVNKQKEELRTAFKLEIFAMILLFIWEVDLIVSTQQKLHNNPSDLFDHIFFAFPMFERRQMIKSIIIPCMNLVEIFIRYYTISAAEQKVIKYGNIESLKQETNVISQAVSKINIDEHINDRVNVTLQSMKTTYPLQVQVFRNQREVLRNILFLSGSEILLRPQIVRTLKYFKLQ